MPASSYRPLLKLTRGDADESFHFGAFAVVDSRGQAIAACGDPQAVTFLRSSAKPFQALPLIEAGGDRCWGFALPEIAITCASHTGTDLHASTLAGMHAKIGTDQNDLLCGVHPPVDRETAQRMLIAGEEPSPNRHNCSGKHTGMLALARMLGEPVAGYLDTGHPVQKRILRTFCEMCAVEPDQVALGTDGCSAPNFAIPLWNAAYGFARLCDPWELSPSRAAACKKISTAMSAHPEMVAGPGKFDTRLMAVTGGKIISKGGAEGYQAVGILPTPTSPGLGIALKISDGDLKGRARPAVILRILEQLGLLTPEELEALSAFGPQFKIYNWRKMLVGQAVPLFELSYNKVIS